MDQCDVGLIISICAVIISFIALGFSLWKSACPLPHNFGDQPWDKDGGPQK
jgi:hypothetical protein